MSTIHEDVEAIRAYAAQVSGILICYEDVKQAASALADLQRMCLTLTERVEGKVVVKPFVYHDEFNDGKWVAFIDHSIAGRNMVASVATEA